MADPAFGRRPFLIVLSPSLPFQSIVVADVMSPKKSFCSWLKHLREDHRARDSEKSKRNDNPVASPTAAIPPTSPTAPHAPTASRTSTAHSTAVASALPSPSERLWDRAYDELKDKESKESKWVNAYEKIMTRLLKKGVLSPTAPEPDENEIETDLAARRLQMNKLVEDGLKKTEKLANVMKGIGNAIRVIDSVKETIGKGIASVPYVGIAWAGVCIALQVSMSFSYCKYKY